jgi:hypothetical protein
VRLQQLGHLSTLESTTCERPATVIIARLLRVPHILHRPWIEQVTRGDEPIVVRIVSEP